MSISWKNWKRGFAALLIALGAHATAFAQTPTFSLEGVVSDAQQAVLPGVTVTITNTATGLTRAVITDTGGRYVITSMPTEGRYRVQVELTGFATAVREDIVFNAGQRALINFSLQLSTVQETITVAGDAPIVQTTSSEVSSTIDRQAFETLPVKERNYFRLLTLDSNVVATGTGSNALNVGGQEVWNFGTYVDGTNNHSKWLTLQRAPQLGSSGFAIETVKEVQLITNQFSAEFGGHSAGVSSMITKTGTNQFNGSAFVMIRPGDLDAAPPLAPIVNGEKVKAPYNQQQFGGTAGGPIVQRQDVLLRQLRAAARAQPGRGHRGRGCGPGGADAGRRAPGPRQARLALFEQEFAGRPLQHGPLEQGQRERRPEPARHRLHLGQQRRHGARHVHDDLLRQDAERSSRPVLATTPIAAPPSASACRSCAQGYSTSGGNDQGTWGVLPEETYDLSTTLSLWSGNHTMKTGASFTYDVTEQLFAPLQNGRYTFSGSPTAAPNPFQFSQAFALTPEARLMFPKAYVLAGFFQDDWRVRNNLTINMGLRYDVEIIKDIPDWPARHGQEQPRSPRRLCVGSEG